MLTDFIVQRIEQELPYSPNEGQAELLRSWAEFILSRESGRTFILKGYAGTGKTSMVSALVRAINKMQQKTILLAPTGRAAKVLSAYSGFPAYTIHKQIYRQKEAGMPSFSLSQNTNHDTLFIVDEASMISSSYERDQFGSGNLLDDLVQYVFADDTCSLLLIGDDAQLPPVGQIESKALNKEYMEGFGLIVREHTLTEVARQQIDSGILFNATNIRHQLQHRDFGATPTIRTEGFGDIQKLAGQDALDALELSYREVGEEDTIVVTRTNRRMNLYNQGIRSRLLWKEDLLTNGDRIMVTRNNYFWTRQYEGLDFLANGDMLEIIRKRRERELYGFTFADVSMRLLDYDREIDATVWLDTLMSESPAASYQMQQVLFERISEDFPEIRSRKELVKTIMENPYFNALQIKHAYAVTCHKAQGGQWKRVFIDPGTPAEEHLNEEFYRWYYTALTRAQEKVVIIG